MTLLIQGILAVCMLLVSVFVGWGAKNAVEWSGPILLGVIVAPFAISAAAMGRKLIARVRLDGPKGRKKVRVRR